MTVRVSSASFIGRRCELAHLERALAAAEAGAPTPVVIAGEAGVGKTRLVGEFAARVRQRGDEILIGGCVGLGADELPYGPFREAFRGLDRTLADPLDLPSADPGAARGAAAAQPGAARARLERVLDILTELGQRTPLVLVIEDLHWADRSTVDLLAFLFRNLRHARVLLVATYRSDEPLTGHPLRTLLAEMDRAGRMQHVDLPRFDREEIAELLGGILDVPPADDLTERVLRRSEGNAFFAEEVLAVEQRAPGAPLPGRLRDVLMVRIEALSADAQQVLRALAVIGGRVGHGLLAAVAELDRDRLLAALREAVNHQVLVTDPDQGTYGFRHQLAREAVYADLLPGERVRLHEAGAAALEGDPWLAGGPTPAVAAELARHWLAGQQPAKALVASVVAARAAADGYAFPEAERQLERALALWDRVAQPEKETGVSHRDLLARAAEAAQWTGDLDRALDLVQQALAQVEPGSDPVATGLLWERVGRYHSERGDTAAALAAYREATRLIGDEPVSTVRARLLAVEAGVLAIRGDYRQSRARCEAAVALARTSGGRAEEGIALTILGVDLAMTDDVEAGIRCLTTACAIAEEVGSLEDVGRAYSNLSFVYENSGRLEDAVAAARRGIGIIRRFGVEETRGGGVMVTNAAAQLVLLGRWDEAEGYLARALAGDTDGMVRAYGFLNRGELRLGRGQLDEAAADLARAEQVAGSCALEAPQFVGPLQACLAELAIWRDSYADAWRAVRRGLDALGHGEDHLLAIRLCALGLRAAADEAARARVRRLPRTDALEATGDALLGRAGGLAAAAQARTRPLPEVAVVAAVCQAEHERLHGRTDPQLWARVATLWESLHRPYPLAYARFRQAEGLLEARLPQRAVQPLRQAYRTAGALPAGLLSREIGVLARRSRLRLDDPPPAAGGPAAGSPVEQFRLTRREREVLGELAEGRTNRQIARALFIEEKTASVHVSNILAKLGAANRVEAAAIAHRLHLV